MKLPYEGGVHISSPYGYRTLNGSSDLHSGLDLVGQNEKTLRAPCDGTVVSSAMITDKSNRTWEWGNYVAIRSNDGYTVYLCHMERRLVAVGETVTAGQPVGIEGNTGYSFGSHCHFEVRRNGTAVNPCPLLGIENTAGVTHTNTFRENTKEDNAMMTGEQIYNALTEYLATLPESEWSKEEGHFADAKEKGTMDGKNPRGLVTREQLAAVLGRKDLL